MSNPPYTHKPDGTPLLDPHDEGEQLFEPSTGWLVCPTCNGDGELPMGELSLRFPCPDCDGTGEPPMRPVA